MIAIISSLDCVPTVGNTIGLALKYIICPQQNKQSLFGKVSNEIFQAPDLNWPKDDVGTGEFFVQIPDSLCLVT